MTDELEKVVLVLSIDIERNGTYCVDRINSDGKAERVLTCEHPKDIDPNLVGALKDRNRKHYMLHPGIRHGENLAAPTCYWSIFSYTLVESGSDVTISHEAIEIE